MSTERRGLRAFSLAFSSLWFLLPAPLEAQEGEAEAAAEVEEEVVEPPPVVAPTVVVAHTPPPVETTPMRTCIGRVHDRARPAIVRVESGLAVGAGFVAVDSRHVITSRALIAEGHDVRVVDVEGNARSARVVATASDDDLALLELASDLAVEPLAIAAWDEVEVGREVVAASFAIERAGRESRRRADFDFGLATGAINARGDRFLQADVPAAAAGSPLVDCDGNVVAVASYRFMDEGPFTMGAGSGAVADLAGRAGSPEGHSGRVRPTIGIGLSLAFEDMPMDREPDLLVGAYLSVGLRVFDAFVITARGHGLFGNAEPSGSAVLRRGATRFRGDAYAAWRQLLVFGPGMGMHFELGLGASVSLVRDTVRSLDIELATGMPVFLDATTEVWRARPMAVLNIEMSFLVIGYTFEVEIEGRNGHVQHLWTLGFQL